jgi:membrane protein YqaA with SNARE-associated domain
MGSKKINIISSWNNMMNSMYDWAIDISKSKYAILALFLISFFESSFFPIPPDVMMIPMILAAPKKAWKIAIAATIGSVLGGYFGYYIGVYLYDVLAVPVLEFYGYMDKLESFKGYYDTHGYWIVFGAGFTPFPYKVITVASGLMGLNLSVFGVASLVSRGTRFFIIAALLWKFGEPMQKFIKNHLGMLATLFFILLIASFGLVKLF